MAMLRHRAAALTANSDARHGVPARLLYSSRRWEDVFYRAELARLAEDDETLEVALTLTHEAPPGRTGSPRLSDRRILADAAGPPAEPPQAFVCGQTPLAQAVATALCQLGH